MALVVGVVHVLETTCFFHAMDKCLTDIVKLCHIRAYSSQPYAFDRRHSWKHVVVYVSLNFPFERTLQQQQVWRCWSLLVYGVRYEWTRSFTDLNARLIRHNRTHLLDLSIVSVVLAMEMLGVSCSKQNSMVTSDWWVRRAIHFYWLFMGWKGNAVIELINQQDTLTERL